MWKKIRNDFWENIVPVRLKSSGIIYPTGSCQVTTEKKDLFEAVE